MRAEDVEAAIACGPGAEHHHEAARAFAEAGSTRLALVQIGGAQDDSLARAETELLPALKEL
ncbi:MAG TPA: hypothetical protein VFN50_04550 [Acidimicrobiales bacterium]|nr:hypothetical protein [Acidimicrobiales bacterium]